MAGRIFLANVGANASHRFISPILPDGTFELIPIPEDRDFSDPYAVRFRDLRSHYNAECDLLQYIPKRLWDWPAHYDPEFETFTYGDNCETSPRGASLKQLEPGDFLFFLAHLAESGGDKAIRSHGFYLVAFLGIAEILRDVRARPDDEVLDRLGANAHIRQGLCDSGLWSRFWVFRGSERSRRFHKAVPITRELVGLAFTAADGSPWRWEGNRTELQVIGSYTRSCRCVIDPDHPGDAERAQALWKWIERYAN